MDKGASEESKERRRRRGETSKKGEAHREETATKERKETKTGRTREEDGRGLSNCSSLNVCYARFPKIAADVYSKRRARMNLVI